MSQKPKPDPAKTMLDNIPAKTGKTLAAWHKLLAKANLAKHGEMMKLLKGEHGLTHGFANLIVFKFKEASVGKSSDVDLLDTQYAGPKAALRPIYDALIALVNDFGKDVEIAPKKSYVSLRRNKQFALIQPSTKTRVDVGLNLKGVDAEGRLENSGSFNAMVSHRVRAESKKDVNAELKRWLKRAYDQS